jgi:glycosyltransferase involved in cell wall biosynthesis
MKKSRISVILPTLSNQKHILVAVRSTLFALGRKDELLVLIEGESSFVSHVEKISDPRLKIFYGPKPKGIVNALNFLIEKATGDLIGRMDGDDICLPFRFHVQRRFMERTGADFVFSNAIMFGKGMGFPGFCLRYHFPSIAPKLLWSLESEIQLFTPQCWRDDQQLFH